MLKVFSLEFKQPWLYMLRYVDQAKTLVQSDKKTWQEQSLTQEMVWLMSSQYQMGSLLEVVWGMFH